MILKTVDEVFQYRPSPSQIINPNGLFMPNFFNSGIFPEDIRDPQNLTTVDEMYFLRSGQKYVSPVVLKYLDLNFSTSQILTRVANMAKMKYGDQWKRLFATFDLTYNPVENYNMTEEMSNDRTVVSFGKTENITTSNSHAKTGTEEDNANMSHAKTGTEQDSGSNSETRTPNLTNTDSKNVYGFNTSASGAGLPDEKITRASTGTETVSGTSGNTKTFNTTDTDTGTDTKTFNTTDTDTGTNSVVNSGSDTHTRNYSLSRSGNIGVTTTQQMLQSEIDIWSMWEIFEKVIFPNIDEIMTIPIY